MKTFLSLAKRVCHRCCVLYTVLSLSLFLIGSAVPQFGNMINVADLMTIFLFSLLLSCANLILGYGRLPIAIRVLLHYLASLAAFLGLFVFIVQQATEAGQILADLVFFTILYTLVMGVYLFLYFSFGDKDRKEEKTYKNIYK